MEELIPKLFILSVEASIVLFLILMVIIIFSTRAKRQDIKAADQLIRQYINSKEERIATIKSHLKYIAFSGNTDDQAEKLYNREKSLLKEFITLYLQRDTKRLLNYPATIIEVDNDFLKTGDSADETIVEPSIPVQEQTEANEAQLKELAELRLKNTELNEHLFEALETINTSVAEHSKKTNQEVESNSQKILEAIIYLRDNRLNRERAPGRIAPSLDDPLDDLWTVALANQEKSEKT